MMNSSLLNLGVSLKRCVIFICFAALSHFSHAEVSVTINYQKFDYLHQPRLNEVLSKVAYEKNWYWPASRLFRLDTNKANNLRKAIIEKLMSVQSTSNDNDGTQISLLLGQIKSWHLSDRISIKLDYDLAQLNPEFNPQFDNGNYRLDLSTLSPYITIFGLTESPRVIKKTTKQCANEYIASLFPQLENLDYIYIIQPNAVVIKTGIAYWNATCVDIMPDSQIYLPLPESQFFSENQELNLQIIELAKNRVLP
jgi:hypothetical protein